MESLKKTVGLSEEDSDKKGILSDVRKIHNFIKLTDHVRGVAVPASLSWSMLTICLCLTYHNAAKGHYIV